MVTVVNYNKRINAETGVEFFTLDLQSSSIDLVRSKNGRMYATKRTCSIGSTFDEESCKALIGTTLEGNISKVECEPYEMIDKNSGEIRVSHHRYEFFMEGETPPEVKVETSLIATEELVGV